MTASYLEDPNHNDQPDDDCQSDDNTESEADEDDDGGASEEPNEQSIQGKFLSIIDAITKCESDKVLLGELDLDKKEDLDKFMKDNKDYLKKVTQPKLQNLLHLIAEEIRPEFLSKIRKLKKLIKGLVQLPGDLLAQTDDTGKTPVYIALSWRNERLVRYMISYHGDVNSILKIPGVRQRERLGNCLHLAIKNKGFPNSDKLLDLLVDKSKKDTLCEVDEQGLTPLHLAVAYERCDNEQLKIVQKLVDKCDEALEKQYKHKDKDLLSPYRYNVITHQEAIRKQNTDHTTTQSQRKEDLGSKEGSLANSSSKDDRKTATTADKSDFHQATRETRNSIVLNAKQANSMAAPTGKYNTASRSSRGFLMVATKENPVESSGEGLTPDVVDKDKQQTRKKSRFSRVQPTVTETSVLAIRQYLKEYCLKTRDHDKAVEILYGSEQERQIYFDLNGTSSTLSENVITQGLRHLAFEDVLQYVAIPQLKVDEEIVPAKRKVGQQPARPDGSGRTDLKVLFKLLKDDKQVITILKIIVDDLEEPSHKDEAIESCLEMVKGIKTWDWRKFDLSPEVIQTVAPDAEVVHLYWGGNNAVLRAWSEENGIRGLKSLKTVHLHSRQGLESKGRMQKSLAAFKSRVATGTGIQVIQSDIRDNISKNAGAGADTGKDIYERHKWVTTMEEFAEFLQNAERNANPPVVLEASVTVALIDDGVDIIDQTIQSKVTGGRSFCHRDKEQNLNQSYYVSGGGHGTAMASYICKICPNVKLYVLRLDEYSAEPGRRNITAASAEKAVKAAIEKKSDIICMSWTINKDENNQRDIAKLEKAIAEAAQANILMFCAATDEGAYKDRSYPAATTTTKNIFKIGAAEASGQAMKWLGDPTLVDFIFPGHQVIKERSDDPSVKKYTALTGSSVSTALASGLAALVLYCIQLLTMANSRKEKKPDLEDYQVLKRHDNVKDAFTQIGTTKESKNKFIKVWERFEKPVQDSSLKPKDTWMDIVQILAENLVPKSY